VNYELQEYLASSHGAVLRAGPSFHVGILWKFLQFWKICTTITSEIVITFVTTVASNSETSVLSAVQFLWINMIIMDTVAVRWISVPTRHMRVRPGGICNRESRGKQPVAALLPIPLSVAMGCILPRHEMDAQHTSSF